MENSILLIIISAILGGAVYYIIAEKKKGNKCIRCDVGAQCCTQKNCAARPVYNTIKPKKGWVQAPGLHSSFDFITVKK